ncbi:MAG: hypothetical protein E6R03_09675 [Hyphomicrobiaceae bacterium]|nr:MAG: hypothetical protein E6R03_09675 [Hyphomicrobiaceae bacterium]
MVQKGKIRNEWVDAVFEFGVMPDEVPDALIDDVLDAVENRKKLNGAKGKVEVEAQEESDLSIR